MWVLKAFALEWGGGGRISDRNLSNLRFLYGI